MAVVFTKIVTGGYFVDRVVVSSAGNVDVGGSGTVGNAKDVVGFSVVVEIYGSLWVQGLLSLGGWEAFKDFKTSGCSKVTSCLVLLKDDPTVVTPYGSYSSSFGINQVQPLLVLH